jgi:hypothetical protein
VLAIQQAALAESPVEPEQGLVGFPEELAVRAAEFPEAPAAALAEFLEAPSLVSLIRADG